MNPDLKIIVVSRQVHKLNIQNTIRRAQTISSPSLLRTKICTTEFSMILPRNGSSIRAGTKRTQTSEEAAVYLDMLLESTELLSRTERGQEHSAFLHILKRISEKLQIQSDVTHYRRRREQYGSSASQQRRSELLRLSHCVAQISGNPSCHAHREFRFGGGCLPKRADAPD